MTTPSPRSREIQEICHAVPHQVVQGDLQSLVTGVCQDSRRLSPGNAFVAVPGFSVDGHQYLEAAVANGAAALVVQADRREQWQPIADANPDTSRHQCRGHPLRSPPDRRRIPRPPGPQTDRRRSHRNRRQVDHHLSHPRHPHRRRTPDRPAQRRRVPRRRRVEPQRNGRDHARSRHHPGQTRRDGRRRRHPRRPRGQLPRPRTAPSRPDQHPGRRLHRPLRRPPRLPRNARTIPGRQAETVPIPR